ncbi:cell-cycle protein [Gracilibacillus halophilus YIM-C55.5]|uniref:tRNA(Ile)-lysidine synthase n=1 Tax=Gracilibacillus halophilus YIM-C55.5 TaxID=1308866 RepID=N4WND6_9BACI|nr:tRNA lysidine(34) synthetase TilS [Gracilibacillus halophilus]ENH97637.1 cell-cycle protein [Gracilibacillus halophilus YIM-C55.5]
MTSHDFDQEVMSFIQKHQLLHKGATVLVGVSGGADSLLLLKYFQLLQKQWDLHVIAVSVDHQLRGKDSQNDLYYVRDICDRWQIPFIGEAVDVKARKRQYKEGTQLAARHLRYQVYAEKMAETKADYLALAHHGDDQLETVVMRVVQHATPSLLQGMPVKRPFAKGFLIRPFLCLSKKQIYTYCHQLGIDPVEDPSNQETYYTRNFFRHQVVPMLKQKNPSVHRNVQQITERLTEDESYLQGEAKKAFDNIMRLSQHPRQASFHVSEWLGYPNALQRRCFHLLLNYLYQETPKNLSVQHEEAFLSIIAKNKANVYYDFPQGLQMYKSYDMVFVYFHKAKLPKSFVPSVVEIPGWTPLPDGGYLKASILQQCPVQRQVKDQLLLPYHYTSTFPLQVRTRQPGDRMKVKGLGGHKKVKDIFIDEKIPLQERDTWPVILNRHGEIIWLIGLSQAVTDVIGRQEQYVLLEYEKRG